MLAEFAACSVLVAFDYDGTLAPIAPTPAAARMRPGTRHLLARVALAYPSVVISGRPLADLTRRLHGIPVWHVMGDHGYDTEGSTGAVAEHVHEWADQLRSRLPARKGLVIEPKRHSVTVHYRHVRDKRRVLKALGEAVSHLRNARAIYGAEAINLLPRDGAHKGLALEQARQAFGCDRAIYAGDDDTDEDAFSSAGPDRLLSIRIGPARASTAQYRLRTQAEIDQLLQALIDLRT